MEEDALLGQVALGGAVEAGEWPALRSDIQERLDKIAHDFPIPTLPPPPPPPRLLSPLSSSANDPSSQETNKENAPVEAAPPRPPDAGRLPKQLADLLAGIQSHLETFTTYAPHTIQRLAEMILRPREHYKALASYLHAVDRVVQVTSGTDSYPLPPAIPDMSSMDVSGEDSPGAGGIAWGNSTTAPLGSDEALGGALLTPIPWLARSSPESNGDAPGAQIHSEGSETIDGPNGTGKVETVSVSVNGVPSTGHARGVTQGELLRQEQRAGVIPVSQLVRGHDDAGDEDHAVPEEDEDSSSSSAASSPHARGPEEIGIGDTGPQGPTTASHMGGEGLEARDIDVAAAVGRKQDDVVPAVRQEASPPPPPRPLSPQRQDSGGSGGGTKREADQARESETPKKVKEVEAEGGAEAGVAMEETREGEGERKTTEAAS